MWHLLFKGGDVIFSLGSQVTGKPPVDD